MKVCFVSHSSGKFGAERALIELIDALTARGVECYVMLPRLGPLADELKRRKIGFSVLPYKWWAGKRAPLWKRIGRLIINLVVTIGVVAKIKQWGCDIVYTNTIMICVGAFAAKLLGLPHVWHIHEFGFEHHGAVFDLGERFSLWLIDHLSARCIANSKAVYQKYQQYIAPSKLRVIYNSVDIPHQVPSKEALLPAQADRKIRCVIVGALQEGKGQEDAIRAIGELVRMGIEAELVIVGDGDPNYRKYLHDLVAESRLSSHVRFTGYTENPWAFMQDAHIVLMCSRYEAFGRVTVEAMKLGKPVIGAKSGGTEELIRDGFNGLLYTPKDHVELAEKIKYLYEHPDIARRLGTNGQQFAMKQFTKDRYGEEVLAVLRELSQGE